MIKRTHQINIDTRELNNSRKKQARTNLKQRVLAGLCAFCLVVLQCFVLGTALPEKAYAAGSDKIAVRVTYKDGTIADRSISKDSIKKKAEESKWGSQNLEPQSPEEKERVAKGPKLDQMLKAMDVDTDKITSIQLVTGSDAVTIPTSDLGNYVIPFKTVIKVEVPGPTDESGNPGEPTEEERTEDVAGFSYVKDGKLFPFANIDTKVDKNPIVGFQWNIPTGDPNVNDTVELKYSLELDGFCKEAEKNNVNPNKDELTEVSWVISGTNAEFPDAQGDKRSIKVKGDGEKTVKVSIKAEGPVEIKGSISKADSVADGITKESTYKQTAKKKETFTVTYYDSLKKTNIGEPVSMDKGSKLTLPEPSYYKEGDNEFQGWIIDGKKYNPGATITITKSITIAASYGTSTEPTTKPTTKPTTTKPTGPTTKPTGPTTTPTTTKSTDPTKATDPPEGPFHVRFMDTEPDDGQSELIKEVVVQKGKSATPPKARKHKGLKFVGWSNTKYKNVTEGPVEVWALYDLNHNNNNNNNNHNFGHTTVRPTTRITTTATRPPTTTMKPSYRKIRVKEVTLGEVVADTPEESEEFLDDLDGINTPEEIMEEQEEKWKHLDFGPMAGSAAAAVALCGTGVVGRIRRFKFDLKDPGKFWKENSLGAAGSGGPDAETAKAGAAAGTAGAASVKNAKKKKKAEAKAETSKKKFGKSKDKAKAKAPKK